MTGADMTGAGATGALLGLLAGLGLALAAAGAPVRRRGRLRSRVDPYLGAPAPGPGRPGSAGPRARTRAARAADRLLGDGDSVRRRLDQLGRGGELERFRVAQLAWGAAALGGALGLGVALTAAGSAPSPAGLALVCGLAAITGALAPDRALRRAVARRDARMMAELPVLAELLALSVGAGEGVLGALERAATVGRGPLAGELAATVADVRAGAPLGQALESLARRAPLPALSRFASGIAVAVDRGTPLADVLRAQAADARDAGRRELLERGGRAEILMMAPVVFLILPTVVVIALYPGYFTLHLYS